MTVPTRWVIPALSFVLICGCVGRTVPLPRDKPRTSVPAPVQVPPAAQDPPPAQVPTPSTVDNNYVEGVTLMKQGKYERALSLFGDVWKKVPGHPGVGENFPTALEGLKKSGDDAYQQGRFEEAGKLWSATMRFLPHPSVKGRSIAFLPEDVKVGIDKLSEFLMEKGLSDYRQGRLQEAVATWRQILAYDPDHEEATKSVKTATTQLENLKKITPPPTGK